MKNLFTVLFAFSMIAIIGSVSATSFPSGELKTELVKLDIEPMVFAYTETSTLVDSYVIVPSFTNVNEIAFKTPLTGVDAKIKTNSINMKDRGIVIIGSSGIYAQENIDIAKSKQNEIEVFDNNVILIENTRLPDIDIPILTSRYMINSNRKSKAKCNRWKTKSNSHYKHFTT